MTQILFSLSHTQSQHTCLAAKVHCEWRQQQASSNFSKLQIIVGWLQGSTSQTQWILLVTNVWSWTELTTLINKSQSKLYSQKYRKEWDRSLYPNNAVLRYHAMTSQRNLATFSNKSSCLIPSNIPWKFVGNSAPRALLLKYYQTPFTMTGHGGTVWVWHEKSLILSFQSHRLKVKLQSVLCRPVTLLRGPRF
jgi:hypothetical protein